MFRIFTIRAKLLILIIVVGSFPGSVTLGHEPGPAGHASDTCVCTAIDQGTGWCSACKIGYVGSVKVPSADLYEMIDPHGHDLDPAGISCRTCLDALAAGSFCDACGIGYVDGRAYVSRLAYLLAGGEPAESPVLKAEFDRLQLAVALLTDCELCGVASFADGRCPRCNIHYRDGKKEDSR